ncbi:Arylsulfatase precursor [Anatilimnocola aggregata]|uniref:Arylsulfatase n=1 Tax=Anatilimnocola aggregata TaxID=2528021 RepID=A0A517YFY4_9BACT|nr:sulfatase-like hydrolase/transferase [Anatilimnocola aggregata]QDU29140.1 Arylsulfatase precursor [Anatilimnocola aggregata]
MQRRLTIAIIIAVVALGSIFVHASHAAEPQPHIVLVLADDLGPGDLSCYGGDIAETPNLDRLARDGTRFTQYYSPAPICSPARCGIITGQYPARWNITSFLQERKGNRECEQADFLDPVAPSLPRILKGAGYATAHVGKWHLGGGRDVVNPPKFAEYGYDVGIGTYESPEPHPKITATNWIWSDKDEVKRWDRTKFFVDRTLEFVAKHPNQPCFVNLWLDDPHTPWVPEPIPGKAEAMGATPKKLERVLTEMDWQIGRLMDGLPKNTLLLFLSDNGPLPTFQARRTTKIRGGSKLRGSKLSLYEGGLCVPLIVRWPGQVPATVVDNQSVLCGIDLLPTLAHIAQAQIPPKLKLDGENMVSSFFGKPIPREQPLYWEYGRNETSFKYPAGADRSPPLAMLHNGWKLLMQADGSGAELYNLARETEMLNEVKFELERAVEMGEKLSAWKKSLPKLPMAK